MLDTKIKIKTSGDRGVRRIGAHVSTAGGHHFAAKRASEIGANCAQIFSTSPRTWASTWEDRLQPDLFQAEMNRYDIFPIFTHALYLVNLASPNADQLEKSVVALQSELEFDGRIAGGGVIVHLGSHLGRGWQAVRDQVVSAILEVIKKTPENSTFLIENSAGQNGKVCSDLSEIAWLIEQVDLRQTTTRQEQSKQSGAKQGGAKQGGAKQTGPGRVGWCLDTCHAFAAGYSLGEEGRGETHPKYPDTFVNLEETIDKLGLWERLKCIHVNDSKGGFGSGLDRHENLLDGKIGESALKNFLSLPKVTPIPLVLEVPGFDGKGPDKRNITLLKELAGQEIVEI